MSLLVGTFLAEFISRFPDINISLHDENAHYVCQMVAHGEVDLGIISIWKSDEDLEYTHLFEDKIGVVCRQDHPLASHETLGWRSLQGEKLIRNGTSRLLMSTAAAELVENSAFYISNTISLIAMLEAGAGITTLPRLAKDTYAERQAPDRNSTTGTATATPMLVPAFMTELTRPYCGHQDDRRRAVPPTLPAGN
ncbi:MAG: hypothetical protein KBT82_05315 [Marinobacter sp.]|uniref:LysR substrate-binding domain-containing protein n=1 Tax=Marinobacter sp. TaxID=50741 RepID=UPI001B7BCCB6|nr:LysR substrate-binding domain-containing protein [Marinobacter sp.]MBQ0747089.1 hypothetical protein [Marinobacter sp.]MBQ0813584.1 hypothetical protein [Marinobacter sp.]